MNEHSLTELDSRSDTFVTISLLWNPDTDEVFIEISTDGDCELIPVPTDEAMNAFHHPFVYAAANSHGHGVTV
jgi:hypothetical protein